MSRCFKRHNRRWNVTIDAVKSVLIVALILQLSAFEITSGQENQEICIDEGVNFHDGEVFDSYKQDGSVYRCTCIKANCTSIRCTLKGPEPEHHRLTDRYHVISLKDDDFPPPSAPSPPPETTTSQQEETTSEPSTTFNSTPSRGDDFCHDPHNNRNYLLGARFVRRGKESQICGCEWSDKLERPEVICSEAQCPFPEPPDQYPTSRYENGCFDYWNDREYRSGSVYLRVRNLSYNGTSTATYRCRCRDTKIKCFAHDVPCCDVDTLEYTRIGGRFVTIRAGRRANCTCLGRNQRYTDCHYLPDNTIDLNSNLESRLAPSIGRRLCYDETSGHYHRLGERILQNRPQSIWLCTCAKIGVEHPELVCRMFRLLRQRFPFRN